MAGKIDIFNMALGFIGTRAVASEKENTPEAAQCRLYWDRARRAALRDFPYPFALRRIRLMPVEMPEAWAGIWQYAYAMPNEALKIVRVGDNKPFEVGQGTGFIQAIYTDEASAVALCVVDTPDMTTWDELFIMAMAYKLAMLIAVPLLKNNPQKIQELASLYQSCLPHLEGHAASERRQPPENSEDWLAARWGWN